MRPTLPATPLARVCLTIWAEAGAVERAASRAHGGSAIGHNEIGRMSTAVAPPRPPGGGSAGIAGGALPWRGSPAPLPLLDLVARAGIPPSRYFPPMTTTFGTLFQQLGEGSFWKAV